MRHYRSVPLFTGVFLFKEAKRSESAETVVENSVKPELVDVSKDDKQDPTVIENAGEKAFARWDIALLQPWQLRELNDHRRQRLLKKGHCTFSSSLSTISEFYFFSKTRSIGTRPLLVLDNFIPPRYCTGMPPKGKAFEYFEPGVNREGRLKDLKKAFIDSVPQATNVELAPSDRLLTLRRYEPVLNKLAHPHGVISVPLRVFKDTPPPLSLQLAADDIITTLDALNISFVPAVIGRSSGALVGVTLAALYPERVGSLVICDTDIAPPRWVELDSLRETLLYATSRDANIPEETLKKGVRALKGSAVIEPPLALDEHFFHPTLDINEPQTSKKFEMIRAYNEYLHNYVFFNKKRIYPELIYMPRTGKRFRAVTATKLFYGNRRVSCEDAALLAQLGGCANEVSSLSAGSHHKRRRLRVPPGMVRDMNACAYLPCSAFSSRLLRHPVLMVHNEVASARERRGDPFGFLNVRKIVAIGGGSSAKQGTVASSKNKEGEIVKENSSASIGSTIFADELCCTQLANRISDFVNLYDIDSLIKKKFNSAIKNSVLMIEKSREPVVNIISQGKGKKKKK